MRAAGAALYIKIFVIAMTFDHIKIHCTRAASPKFKPSWVLRHIKLCAQLNNSSNAAKVGQVHAKHQLALTRGSPRCSTSHCAAALVWAIIMTTTSIHSIASKLNKIYCKPLVNGGFLWLLYYKIYCTNKPKHSICFSKICFSNFRLRYSNILELS